MSPQSALDYQVADSGWGRAPASAIFPSPGPWGRGLVLARTQACHRARSRWWPHHPPPRPRLGAWRCHLFV